MATIATGIAILWSFVQGSPAALLFIVFALTSLFLFTESDSPNPSPKKKMRNVWYRVCGWAILACIALIGLYGLLKYIDKALYDRIGGCNPVFWLEAGAVISFGVALLVKGESFEFLRD